MSSAAKSVSASQLLQNAIDSLSSTSEIDKQEYKGAPLDQNEEERLRTVNRLGKLEWVSQEQYDAFTAIVCDLFNVPLSVATLVLEDIQWFRSVQGLEGVTETPRSISFCAWALLPKNTEVLLVQDARKDIRFFNNPAVTGPLQVASYVGCPMVLSTGQRLGNLCGFANDPLKVSRRQVQMLCNLTEVLVREFEREQIQQYKSDADHFYNAASTKLIRPTEVFEYGYLIVDVSCNNLSDWKLALCTQQAAFLVGKQAPTQKNQLLEEFVGSTWISCEDEKRVLEEQRFTKTVKCLRNDGTQHWLQATFIPGHVDVLDQDTPPIQLPQDLIQGNEKQYYFIQLQTLSQPDSQFPSFLKLTSQLLSSQDNSINIVQILNSSRSVSTQGSFIHQSENKTVQRAVRNGQTVIIKTLNMWDDPQNFDLIYSNLQLLKQFTHPNLIQIIDVIPERLESTIQIVTEYCNAGSLLQIQDLDAFFEQDLNSLIDYCVQIGRGIQFLHEKVNICHGRLGPENIMLTSQCDGNNLVVKICDAGQQLEMTSFRFQNQFQNNYVNFAGDGDAANNSNNCTTTNNNSFSVGQDDKGVMDDIEDFGRILSFVFKACDSWIGSDIKQQLLKVVQGCFEIDDLDSSRCCLEDVILQLQNLQRLI